MLFLVRMQESLRCTRREALFLLGLIALYSTGLMFNAFRSVYTPYDDAFYAPTDSVFAVLSSREPEPSAGPWQYVINDTLEVPPDFPINLNTAPAEDLQHLPRIGPALAGRIIAHRSEKGPFTAVEELTAVSGIGPKTLEGLLDLVTVEPDTLRESTDTPASYPDSTGSP